MLLKVVLENSGRSDDHDLPFARASIELTNVMCEILKVGEQRTSTNVRSSLRWCLCCSTDYCGIVTDTLVAGWLDSLVVRALVDGCEFDYWPPCCRSATLGKLFTLTCPHAGRSGLLVVFVYHDSQCDIHTASGTGCTPLLQCLSQLSLPPIVGQ